MMMIFSLFSLGSFFSFFLFLPSRSSRALFFLLCAGRRFFVHHTPHTPPPATVRLLFSSVAKYNMLRRMLTGNTCHTYPQPTLARSLGRAAAAARTQFGIYDYFRKQLLNRKAEEEDQEDDDGLLYPPTVSRRLRYSDGTDDGLARRLYLLEEELL